MLARHGIDKERIHIFVASNEELLTYQTENPGYKFIVAQKGLANARNFISDYFPVGQPIMNFDDDVTEIKQKVGTRLQPIPDLHAFITLGFATCIEHGRRMFGLYPVPNGMFMKDRMQDGLHFCTGPAWGILNPGASLRISLEYKEDYERCILMYLKDGGILRFEYVAACSTFYKGDGGLNNARTKELVAAEANYLLTKYPQFIKSKKPSKLGFVEIKLGMVCK